MAARGRSPSVDALRTVSRSQPHAATDAEKALAFKERAALGAYAESELMIKAGLYAAGSDPMLDEAVKLYPALDAFVARASPDGSAASFTMLANALRAPRGGPQRS